MGQVATPVVGSTTRYVVQPFVEQSSEPCDRRR
jgi:hypothetical protein